MNYLGKVLDNAFGVIFLGIVLLCGMWGYGFASAVADINGGSYVRATCKYMGGGNMNSITRHGYIIGTRIYARSRYNIDL